MLTLLSKMSVQLPQSGSFTASLPSAPLTISRLAGSMRKLLGQLDLVAVAIDDELGVEARGNLDVGAEVAFAGALELNLIDAGARLAVGGLAFPRSDLLRIEAVRLGGERARNCGEAGGHACGNEEAESAATRIHGHGPVLLGLEKAHLRLETSKAIDPA